MPRRRGPSDDEFRDEIEAHIALETDRLIAEGLAAEDAAARARRTFGNSTRVRERLYEARRLMWLEDARQDIRFTLRSLKRSPGFLAVAILTLGVGIGVNTALFSVVNAALLRPLGYTNSDALVVVEHPPLGGSPRWLRDAWRSRARTLTDFAGFEPSSGGTIVIGNQPLPVNVARAAPGFFELLGVTAAAGRVFSDTDATPGAPAVALVSHGFWVRQLGASPEALGRTIRLTDVAVAGEMFAIAGVLPRGFRFPVAEPRGRSPLFVPGQPDIVLPSRDDAFQHVLGRLSPHSTAAAATSELAGIFRQEAPSRFGASLVERTKLQATPLRERLLGDATSRLALLAAAAGCVLLVVGANIANLLLARMLARQTEFAVRSALGARTSRLIRLVFTESLVLAGLGSAGALLLAYMANGVLQSTLVARVSYVERIPIDWSVLAFTAALAAATGALSGLASLGAIRFGGPGGDFLRAGRSVTGRSRLRRALMGAEVAVAFVLVLTAALLSRTLWNLSHAKTGFTSDRLLTAAVMPGMSGTIPELQDVTATLFDRITERIGRVPGVESVAAVSTAPFGGPVMGMSGVSVVGRPPADGVGASVSVAVVTPGYFGTMAVRLVAGRDFDRLDRPDRERVAIVNEALARTLGNDLVGRQITFGRSLLTVAGIVGDTPDTSLRERARPFVYVPLAQMLGSSFVFSRLTILARASGEPRALVPAFREAVWSLGHDIVIDEVSTMDERLSAAVRTERDSAALVGLLAAIALLTALVGVYGVVAYSVAQRGREIGIRIALGASSRQVVGGIVRESAWPMAAGIVVGVAGAVVAARAVASILFEVEPTDPATYVAAALALILTTLAAAWIPARDAARVDPIAALRAE